MSFRTNENLQRYEYVRFHLDNVIEQPANNQSQKKTGYRFTINDRSTMFDFFNGYIEVTKELQKRADGTGYAQADRITMINGSSSLIKHMVIRSSGKIVYESDNLHRITNVKNLLEYSDDYSRSVAKNQFWYLDNDATTVTSDAATNLGMRQRALLSHEGITVETILSLKRYSFFEGLSDRLLPPMQADFEIVPQDDTEMIFLNDGTARRIVVRKFELWVPQLQFTGKGQKLVNKNILKPTQWKYLKEMLHLSSSRRDANGRWLITPGVKNPKHVFVFFQQTKAFTQNPHIFDTFDLDGYNSAKLATCRLQYGTTFYPELEYEGEFKIRILNDLIDFRYRKNDYNSGVQLQLANFKTLSPIIYFDLRNAKERMTGDPKKRIPLQVKRSRKRT